MSGGSFFAYFDTMRFLTIIRVYETETVPLVFSLALHAFLGKRISTISPLPLV